ncbi:MAG: hypothetical protein M3460_22175 [Actinomycetota bacterium]|nr:hypothetical protein [Actinomycetota bacterium]
MSTYPHVQTRARRRPLAVLAAAAGLALAGCGSDLDPTAPASPAPPVAPQEQTVRWTDSVCSALVPVVDRLGAPPAFDLTAPAATRQAYSTYLAEAQAAAERALESVSAAGSPPVEGGEQIANEVRSDIAELRDDLADARTQVDQADPNNAVAFGRAVVAASNVLGALANNAQALGALDGNPRLDAAFEQAQSCQQLRAINIRGG